jgi:Zn-dependent peptidase ImmA (M78 family)
MNYGSRQVKKFKLAGAIWTICYSPDIHDLGHTDPDTSSIFVNSKQDEQSQALTLSHEIVHAILFTMGERDHDERFVEGFAQLLYQYEQQAV